MSMRSNESPANNRTIAKDASFAAVYVVYDDHLWLRESLDSVYHACDLVLFLVAEKPWFGEPSDNTATLDVIRSYPDPARKIRLVRGTWTNETDQRNAGLDMLSEAGINYCFVVDSDETYEPDELRRMQAYAASHPEIACWHMEWEVYWKSHEYVISPREPFRPVVFVRVGQACFSHLRAVDGGLHAIIPAEVGICHHFAYARPDAAIYRKVTTFAHANEILPDWYQRVWKGWDSNPGMIDLHPTHPPCFKQAILQPTNALPSVVRKRLRDRADQQADANIPEASSQAHYYEFARPEIKELVPANARRILDIGCATGALGKALKDSRPCEVTGIELVPEVAERARRVLDHVHTGDIREIAPELPDGYYDCAIMADVLEHLPDPGAALRSLLPKLASTAKLVISVPNVRHWSVVRGLLEGRWDYEEAGLLDRTHLRFFTRSSFERLLREVGLRPTTISGPTIGGEAIPPSVLTAMKATRLNVQTLAEESSIYQFLYVAEPVLASQTRDLTSIIILAYNQLEDTQLCLASIERNTPEPHELILVDNGSTDGTREYLQAYAASHDNVHVIYNQENRGFAGGNNQGLAIARGEHMVLLNNDTVVTEGWLERMRDVLERESQVGIVGPVSNYVSGPQLVPDCSYQSLDEMDAFARQLAVANAGQSQPSTRVVGFCLMAKRAVIERIGGLDERFGSGNFEDDDFCVRAVLAGFKAHIARDVFIHHTGSRTFTGANIDYRASMLGNWEVFKAKWGIPADTPLEAGYQIPTVSFTPALHHVALPECNSSHTPNADRSWNEKSVTESPAKLLPARDQNSKIPVDPQRHEAIAAARAGQWQVAVDLAEACLAALPDDHEVINVLAVGLFRTGQSERAKELLRQALTEAPNSRDLHHNLAFVLLAEEDAAGAIRHALAAFRIDTASAEARRTLERAREAAVRKARRARKQSGSKVKDGALAAAIQEADSLLGGAQPEPAAKQIAAPAKLRISAVMIVKNEEKYLGGCLESLKGHIDEVIVVDTGSTDHTMEIAESFGAKIHRHAWNDDFAEARNVSLDAASGDWVLHIDADERLTDGQGPLLRYLVENAQPDIDGYLVNIGNHMSADSEQDIFWHRVCRLFRHRKDLRFEGRIHEQIVGTGGKGPTYALSQLKMEHFGYIGSVMIENGKHERNIRILTRAIEETPEGPQRGFQMFNLGSTYYTRGDYEQAANWFAQAVERVEKIEEYTWMLFVEHANALEVLGRTDEALAVCDRAETLGLENPGIDYTRGVCHTTRKEYALAEKCYLRAIEQGKNALFQPQGDAGLYTYKAYYGIAAACLHQERFEETVRWCREAIAAKPDMTDAHYLLSLALRKLDRRVEARRALEETIRLHPDHAAAHTDLGSLLYEEGAYKAALPSLRVACEAQPDTLEHWSRRADCSHRLGLYEEACDAYEAVIRLAPNAVEPRVNLGRVYTALGEHARAIDCYADAIQMAPDYANAYFNAGDALYQMGYYPKAAETLCAGLERDPGNASGFFVLGNCYAQTRDFAAARVAYQAAIERKPDYAEALSNMALVEEMIAQEAEAA